MLSHGSIPQTQNTKRNEEEIKYESNVRWCFNLLGISSIPKYIYEKYRCIPFPLHFSQSFLNIYFNLRLKCVRFCSGIWSFKIRYVLFLLFILFFLSGNAFCIWIWVIKYFCSVFYSGILFLSTLCHSAWIGYFWLIKSNQVGPPNPEKNHEHVSHIFFFDRKNEINLIQRRNSIHVSKKKKMKRNIVTWNRKRKIFIKSWGI